MPTKDLVFRFLGVDGGAGREFDKMAGKSATLEKAITGLGVGMVGAAGAIAVESVRAAAKFQQSMELIHTQAGRSQAAVDQMSKAVLQLAGPTATSPDELAKGLYHLASTGLSTAKSMEALKIAAQGAKMGGADLESVTNALNATIVSGIKGSKDYAAAMGALNSTVGAGDMRMQDLADALSTGVLASVKGFGLSLNDVGAALATFGDNNMRGAEAATQLRMAVLFMAKPAASAKKELEALGMTQSTLANDMRTKGLGGALIDLHQHLVDAGVTGAKTGQILVDLFGHRAGTGLAVLEEQLGRFQKKQEEVAHGSRNFASDWQAYTQTFGYSWDRAKSAFESMTIQLGTKLLPTATKAMNWIGTTGVSDLDKFGGWVSRNKGPIEDVARALAAIGAVRIGMGIADKVNGIGRMVTGGGGRILGSAEGAAGMRVFVTNMPPGGFGGGGSVAGTAAQTAERDAQQYGPAALPFLSRFKTLTRIGPGIALTGATLTDKLGPATHQVPGGMVRADAPANLKTLLQQVHEITTNNAAAAASFRHLGSSIDVRKVQEWVAEWRRGDPALRQVQQQEGVLNRYLVQNTGLAKQNAAANRAAAADIIRQYRQIPGAMGQIAAQMKAEGTNIGAMLDAGLTVGIQQNANQIMLVTKQVVDGVVHVAHNTAQLGSPSKRTTYIGKMIAAGLELGLRSGKKGVAQAATDLMNSVFGNIIGQASLSNVHSMTDSLGAPGGSSINDILRFLGGQVSSDKALARNLAVAQKKGLARSVAQQVAMLGPDAGPLAQSLAGASRAQIAAVNRDEAAIARQAQTIAGTVSLSRQTIAELTASLTHSVSHVHVHTDRHRLDKRNGVTVMTH